MSLDLSRRILKEAYEMGVRKVGMYTIGEMFLCKDIAEHIASAKALGYEYIYSDTNGFLANRENLEKVINAGLDSIKFSINAGTRETYKFIHGVDGFDRVLENLKTCYELRNKLNKNLKILVSYVITKQNQDELEGLKKLVAPYVTNEVYAHPMQVRTHREDDERFGMIPACFSIDSCHVPFSYVNVTFDGYLSACCIDFYQELIIADLNKVSLKDAWYSDKFQALRERLLSNELTGLMCDGCLNGVFKQYKRI